MSFWFVSLETSINNEGISCSLNKCTGARGTSQQLVQRNTHCHWCTPTTNLLPISTVSLYIIAFTRTLHTYMYYKFTCINDGIYVSVMVYMSVLTYWTGEVWSPSIAVFIAAVRRACPTCDIWNTEQGCLTLPSQLLAFSLSRHNHCLTLLSHSPVTTTVSLSIP